MLISSSCRAVQESGGCIKWNPANFVLMLILSVSHRTFHWASCLIAHGNYVPVTFVESEVMSVFQCGTCTLREATIVASVLAKNSVPLLHSAAAIIKIAEMDYNGANSIFLRMLLDKKYALPYQAVDAVVYHFIRYSVIHYSHSALLLAVGRVDFYNSCVISQSLFLKHKYGVTPKYRAIVQR